VLLKFHRFLSGQALDDYRKAHDPFAVNAQDTTARLASARPGFVQWKISVSPNALTFQFAPDCGQKFCWLLVAFRLLPIPARFRIWVYLGTARLNYDRPREQRRHGHKRAHLGNAKTQSMAVEIQALNRAERKRHRSKMFYGRRKTERLTGSGIAECPFQEPEALLPVRRLKWRYGSQEGPDRSR
jgi:hypothetical protein